MNKKLSWTRPYFGVSHLNFIKNPYKVTITGTNDNTIYGYIAGEGFCDTLFEIYDKLDVVKRTLEGKSKELQILA